MKQLTLIAILLFAGKVFSQSELNGNWALAKIVTVKGDTQIISKNDKRFVSYSFSYNNTFKSYHEEQKMDATGKWGFDKKENAIKIKSHTFLKTKEGLGDYLIKLREYSKFIFVEIKEEKKKPVAFWIYVKQD